MKVGYNYKLCATKFKAHSIYFLACLWTHISSHLYQPDATKPLARIQNYVWVYVMPTLQSKFSRFLKIESYYHYLKLKEINKDALFILQSSISHPDLYEIMSQLIQLYDQIKSKALTRLQHDGLFNSSDVTDPSGKYFQDPTGFAMDRYAYYMCSKCQQVHKSS